MASGHTDSLDIRGKHVLIVEDDVLLAMGMQDDLEDNGAVVVGPVATVDAALALIAGQQVDGAMLDIELIAEKSYPIADMLLSRGIPFVFVSGADRATVPKQYCKYLLSKSTSMFIISRALFGE